MKYLATIAGSEHEVEVLSTTEGLVARCGDVEVPVRVDRERAAGSYTLSCGRRLVPITVLEDGGDSYEILLLGRRHRVAVESEVDRLLQRGSEGVGGRPTVVHSVMPGIVTRVLVEKGGTVSAGQPLLLLEAMKMENEVRAEKDGIVLEIHVQPGSTVQSGASLVTTGPSPADASGDRGRQGA